MCYSYIDDLPFFPVVGGDIVWCQAVGGEDEHAMSSWPVTTPNSSLSPSSGKLGGIVMTLLCVMMISDLMSWNVLHGNRHYYSWAWARVGGGGSRGDSDSLCCVVCLCDDQWHLGVPVKKNDQWPCSLGGRPRGSVCMPEREEALLESMPASPLLFPTSPASLHLFYIPYSGSDQSPDSVTLLTISEACVYYSGQAIVCKPIPYIVYAKAVGRLSVTSDHFLSLEVSNPMCDLLTVCDLCVITGSLIETWWVLCGKDNSVPRLWEAATTPLLIPLLVTVTLWARLGDPSGWWWFCVGIHCV